MKKSLSILGITVVAIMAAPLMVAAYDNSPLSAQILPEVIWAPATGGGTWMTEVMIIDMTGGSQVHYNFYYGGGSYRGPNPLWTGTQYQSVKYSNILETFQSIDASFNYYGRVGTLFLATQDLEHKIQVVARTVNGNYSKTFPGIFYSEANTAAVGRDVMIIDLVQNAKYRSTVGFFSPGESCTVAFLLVDSNGQPIGSLFSKTFVANDFQAFYPFAEAGVPSGTYDNVWLIVHMISGSGYLYCFGATANNYTNDPAAHIPKQFQ